MPALRTAEAPVPAWRPRPPAAEATAIGGDRGDVRSGEVRRNGPPTAPAVTGDARRRPASLSRRLLLLVAAVALPLVGLAAWAVWTAQQAVRARAEEALLERVHMVALAIEREFDRAGTLLDALAASSALARGDLAAFEAEMRAASAALGGVPVTLVSADGTIALSTLWPPGERRSGVHAPDVALRVIAEGRAEVADLFRAPLTGLLSVAVGAPVFAAPAAAGGEDARAVLGGIGLSFPRDRVAAALRAAAGLSEEDAAAGRVAAVLDRSGVSVARTGREEGIVGRPARPETLGKLVSRDGGIVTGLTTLDGVPAVTAVARGPRSGYVYLLTMPEAEFAAPLRSRLARALGLGALVLAAGLGLAALVARRTIAAFRTASAAAEGRLPAPGTGLREADDLARALANAIGERGRAEAALREAEWRTAEVLSSIGEVLYSLDPDGRFAFVSTRALAFWGKREPQELLGRRFDDLFPEGVGSVAWHAKRQAMECGEEVHLCLGSAVTGRWIEADIYPRGDGGITVAFRDIEQRRRDHLERARAEAERRESEERFRLVAESAPVMLWMGDTAGRCVYLNRAQREFWGVEEAALGEFDWSRTVHPEDREALFAAFGPAMAASTGFEVEARYRRADGMFRTLHTVARPRFGAGGRFLGMIGMNADVTEARRAEAALRASEERLRELLATLDLTAVLVCDLDGTIRHWSAGCERLYGWPAGEAVGRRAHELLATRCPDPPAEVEAALRRGGEWQGDLRQRRRDGSEVVVAAHKALRRDAEGRPVAVAESLTDVTELRRAEERQALLMREVDHRAKNALAVVAATVRLTPKDDPEAFTRAVEGRVAALARAHTMLAQGRWEGAALRPLIGAELAAFLPRRAGAAAAAGAAAPPRVEASGPDLTLAPVAAQALSMALHELATNAVKYGALSGPAGRVVVSWGVDDAAGLLRLRWSEAGGPPVAAPPSRRGFGSRVIEATVRDQLGGRVERRWEPGGLVCDVAVPLARAVAAAGAGEVQPPGFATAAAAP